MDAEVAELLRVDRAAPADESVGPDDRPAPSAPDHPFYQLKRMTLLGYFTSERSIRHEPIARGSTSQSSEVTPSWAQYSPVLLQPSNSAPWV